MTELPLLRRRIALTRPHAQSISLAERLRALGADPLIAPAIAIAPSLDRDALIAAVNASDRYAWAVLGSAHAAATFAETCAQQNVLAAWQRRCAAIGPATAAALTAAGITPANIPAQPSARALVQSLGNLTGLRILHPCSDRAPHDVVEEVSAEGGVADRIVAYRTVAGPGLDALTHALASRALHAIVFASPSAVHFLLEALRAAGLRDDPLREAEHPVIICAGSSAAAALQEADLPVDEVVTPPSLDGLVAVLVRRLANRLPSM